MPRNCALARRRADPKQFVPGPISTSTAAARQGLQVVQRIPAVVLGGLEHLILQLEDLALDVRPILVVCVQQLSRLCAQAALQGADDISARHAQCRIRNPLMRSLPSSRI